MIVEVVLEVGIAFAIAAILFCEFIWKPYRLKVASRECERKMAESKRLILPKLDGSMLIVRLDYDAVEEYANQTTQKEEK